MAGYALDLGDLALPAGDYLPALAFQVPDIAGLVGAYILGGGAALAAVNCAVEASPPTIVGSPAWSDGYAALGAANYLNTGLAETEAMTLLVVARRIAAGNAPFIGNYTDGTNIGVALYGQNANANVVGNADRGPGGGSANVVGNTDEMRLYSLTIPASGAMTIRDHTAGTSASSAATGARVVETANKIRIGSFPGAGFTIGVRIVAAAVASRDLTSDELASMVTWMRDVASFYGLTV